MSNAQRIGRAVTNPVAPTIVEPVTVALAPPVTTPAPFVLAAITPDTASKVAKGLADAVAKDIGQRMTFMASCLAAARLIGVPITSGQYDKQVAPSVREAFNAKAKVARKDPKDFAAERSRMKTFCLAVCTGMADFQPIAGETVPTFLKRVSQPLESATHTDGRKVWDTAKRGAVAGSTPAAPGQPAGSGQSKGQTDDDEGGLNVRPMLAAALILTRDNASLAGQLVIACESYRDEMAKWLSGILTDDDKKELQAKTA